MTFIVHLAIWLLCLPVELFCRLCRWLHRGGGVMCGSKLTRIAFRWLDGLLKLGPVFRFFNAIRRRYDYINNLSLYEAFESSDPNWDAHYAAYGKDKTVRCLGHRTIDCPCCANAKDGSIYQTASRHFYKTPHRKRRHFS